VLGSTTGPLRSSCSGVPSDLPQRLCSDGSGAQSEVGCPVDTRYWSQRWASWQR